MLGRNSRCGASAEDPAVSVRKSKPATLKTRLANQIEMASALEAVSATVALLQRACTSSGGPPALHT